MLLKLTFKSIDHMYQFVFHMLIEVIFSSVYFFEPAANPCDQVEM